MSFPQQDYLAMLKAKPPVYNPVQQNSQTPMIYPNPQFMQAITSYQLQYIPHIFIALNNNNLQASFSKLPILLHDDAAIIINAVNAITTLNGSYANSHDIVMQQFSQNCIFFIKKKQINFKILQLQNIYNYILQFINLKFQIFLIYFYTKQFNALQNHFNFIQKNIYRKDYCAYQTYFKNIDCIIPQSPQLQTLPQPVMPYQMQPQNPTQQKIDNEIPVQVKGTKVKLNLKMIKDLPIEDDSILDFDEIKKQSGNHQYINLKRKRRLLDQQEAPLMQTRRRSEQSQYLEIREMLKIDDKDMTIILEVYPDTKTLLQELRKGNLKKDIEKLLLK